jgi:hypothetical protein
MTLPLAGWNTIVLTILSAAGAHGRSTPDVASTAASRVRVTAPSRVKSPPRYTVSPATAIASTRPFGPGFHARRSPVCASSAATRVRTTPFTRSKSPPT